MARQKKNKSPALPRQKRESAALVLNKRKSSTLPNKKQLPPGPFDKLPDEILLCITSQLLERGALSLAKVNSRFYRMIIPEIYRKNAREEHGDALLWGVRQRTVETIKRALAAGVDVNADIQIKIDAETGRRWISDGSGAWRKSGTKGLPFRRHRNTPLCEAAERGYADIVRVLLDAGAQLTDRGCKEYENHQPMAPLFSAAQGGNIQVLQLLLAVEGADINVMRQDGNGLLVSAVEAGSVAMTEYIYNNLRDPLANVSDSRSILSHAIINRRRDVLQYLLGIGKFDVNQPTLYNSSPFLDAARSEPDILHMMLKQPDIDFAAANDRKVLIRAIHSSNDDCVEILLSHPQIELDPFDAFEAAADYRKFAVADYLLYSKKIPKSPCQATGKTWMHVAARLNLAAVIVTLNKIDKTMLNTQCSSGNTPLAEAARHGREEVVKKLLRFKADVNIANNRGETPLHIVCGRCAPSLAKNLIAKGANVHAKTHRGDTPLHMACHLSENIDKVKQLIRAGASVREINNEGQSPIDIASTQGFENMVTEMRKELSNEEHGL